MDRDSDLSHSPANAPRARVLIAINTFASVQREMIQGIIRYTRTHSPSWELTFRKGQQSPSDIIRRCPRHDAAIAGLWGPGDGGLSLLVRRGVPTVLIEHYKPSPFPIVRADNRAIAQLAFDHLQSKGFQSYAYVGHGHGLFGERRAAFADAVRSAKRELVAEWRLDYEERVEQNRPLRRWLREVAKPVALFAGNADMARQVVSQCRASGVRVPEDIAVIGVDAEMLECELEWPPLSTIDHGMERAGYTAAALLHRIMQGHSPPSQPILVQPVGVLERQSTDTLAVDDPNVRAALQLIRQHAVEGLSVKQLLDQLPVARRKLEIGFRQSLGRSILSELTRVKMERAKFLLRTTDLPIPEIAFLCGYKYAANLSLRFAREVGTSVSAYRRETRRP